MFERFLFKQLNICLLMYQFRLHDMRFVFVLLCIKPPKLTSRFSPVFSGTVDDADLSCFPVELMMFVYYWDQETVPLKEFYRYSKF